MRRFLILILLLSVDTLAADFDGETSGLTRQSGLWTIYSANNGGKVLAQLPTASERGVVGQYIYATRLRSGLGSNPVGLDRGRGDFGRLISVIENGDRVFVIADNLEYRATSSDPDERRATRESFARSIVWSAPILARAPDGGALIDLRTFLLRDQLGIAELLKSAGQGRFSLDDSLSLLARDQLVFPDNLELEAVLTFTSDDPGSEVSATASDPRAVSFALHHSIVRLPEAGYRIRESDPRTAVIDIGFYDFAQPLEEPLLRRLARRFRLQKIEPGRAPSGVVKPIVFYIDRGAPEPIRSALLDGAGWWADAFESAGFEGGYRVEVLPEGAHPLDIRYNVVQWVHRQTRGWSYGGGVADPRTGEMIKGHVILGSQRVRQDRMIFEGLTSRSATGDGGANDPMQVALARIRQLAAHEVGHALGFAHNMAASADNRASVMDYPAPLATLDENGNVDLSNAYAVGMGAWDDFTVQWLYGEFDDTDDERTALDALTEAAFDSGLHFVADAHSRPISAAHARGSLWDNGSDPVASLENVMRVRKTALRDFGSDRLSPRQSLSDLQTVFAPIYLYHRYQVLAATKLIGGYEFDYRRAADSGPAVIPVSAARQRAALDAVVATLEPSALAIPEAITRTMAPPIDAWEPIAGRERIATQTGVIFDPLHSARVATSVTLRGLLSPERLARLEHVANGALSAQDVLQAVGDVLLDSRVSTDEERLAQFAALEVFASMLMRLDADCNVSLTVRDTARASLIKLPQKVRRGALYEQRGTARLAQLIQDYLEDGLDAASTATPAIPEIPPGSPIGASSCWHCDSATLLLSD
ncbi:MAG: zinc-dependent metalloprotease [Pseudomonadota bacterium]